MVSVGCVKVFSKLCVGFNSFLMIYYYYLIPKSWNSSNHIMNSKLEQFPIKPFPKSLNSRINSRPQMSAAPEPEVPGLVGQSSEAGPLYTWQPTKENWTAATFCVRKEAMLMPRPIQAVGSGEERGSWARIQRFWDGAGCLGRLCSCTQSFSALC